MKVSEREENPLMEREELRFEVEHKNAPTPSRAEVLEELSKELDIPEDLIVIEKVATPHGRQIASGIARVYESEDQLKELEPKHLIERTEVSGEEAEEVEEEAGESEEETEEEVEEETEEEEKAEEETEEEETEESEQEESTGETKEEEESSEEE